MDSSIYQILIEIGRRYEETLQRLNLQAIKLMKSDEFMMTLKAIDQSVKKNMVRVENVSLALTRFADQIKPYAEFATSKMGNNLFKIANQYSQLLGSYNASAMSESMRTALENIQLKSICQLSLSYETEMIHDAIGCFANAKYEYLPSVFNQAMKKPIIGAADVAFLKNGIIIPVVETELIYPRGFKTSLGMLNRSTAEDISDNDSIDYDTKKHRYITITGGTEDSRGLNLVCAFRDITDSDELFTEVELVDFVSVLASTPMLALTDVTGIKILNWIRELLLKKINLIGFDRKYYYHCRSHKETEMPFPYDEMLKAPHGVPGIGRYNSPGVSHYYFASTQKGAEVEVRKHLKKDEVLQTVKLRPVKSIRLLDLSGTLQRGAMFLKMIRFPVGVSSNNLPKEYLLPGFVGECCKKIGFDGIKYFGSAEYDNYVSWTDGYFENAGMC